MSRHALVCSYYPPQYDRDSGSRRIYDLVGLLRASGWQVTFVATNGITEQRYVTALGQLGVPVQTGADFEGVVADGRFDLALFAFWQVAELLLPAVRRLSPATRVMVDSVDVQLLRDARRLFTQGRLLDADYAAQVIGELNVYAAADGVLAVSAQEAQLIDLLVGQDGLSAEVPDCEAMPRSPLAFADRQGVVFVGSLRHAPNVDAVEWLCAEIVPRLNPALLMDHPVTIVGDGLTPAVAALARDLPAVRMVGWVPDLTPYLHRARVSVLPLRFGAGTKRKMLQTLLAGTPPVSTTVGIEGLGLLDGVHALVADDADGFAERISRLLEEPSLWGELSDAGHAHIVDRHSSAAVGAALGRVVGDVLVVEPKGARLPEGDRTVFDGRVAYQFDQQLVALLRNVLLEHVGPGSAVVATVTEGRDELLQLGDVTAWHFPRGEDGRHTGVHPHDSAAALELLAGQQARGATHLLIPVTAGWWREYYPDLTACLEQVHSPIFGDPAIGWLYELRHVPSGGLPPTTGSISEAQPTEWSHAVAPTGDGSGVVATLRHPPVAASPARSPGQPRALAFYLPQFHPIPENDAWWGEGFTEWTNVTRAQPLFAGHEQPRLPADLGFYDLRLAETRAEQADLARAHGIDGFVWYHYWFSGTRLLHEPFDEVLRSGEPDFPFALCWANEPWSRRWDGRPNDILQEQRYSPEDDLEHIRWLLPALADPRAITVDGKPLLLIYQAKDLPEPGRTVDVWRSEVARAGLPDLHLLCVETGWDSGWDATAAGFDGKVGFQPQFTVLQTLSRMEVAAPDSLRVYDYQAAWPVLADLPPVGYRRYPCVFPRWDNTARRGSDGWVVHNSTPDAYARWLRRAVESVMQLPDQERLVFINAWNEWGEGCHLEPDLAWGDAYLEATRTVLRPGVAVSPSQGVA